MSLSLEKHFFSTMKCKNGFLQLSKLRNECLASDYQFLLLIKAIISANPIQTYKVELMVVDQFTINNHETNMHLITKVHRTPSYARGTPLLVEWWLTIALAQMHCFSWDELYPNTVGSLSSGIYTSQWVHLRWD